MREIKFRAWLADPSEPYDGVMFYDVGFMPPDEFLCDGDWIDTQDGCLTHEQYTGLKDKNGKEIYEGDIIAIRYTGGLKLNQIMSKDVVSWGIYDIGCNGMEYSFTVNGPYVNDEYLYNQMNEGLVEVIGNIHENPELL